MPANHNRLRALASLSVIFVVLHLAQPIVIPFMIGVLIAVGVSGVLRVSEWGCHAGQPFLLLV